ncbi:conserved hypothetical protein [Synechococcus elongatus PCC 7942 = FACHB-805]|uniref:Uncharacterized protein n=1 Tax=Synechococcus elongatus (strain ATCC 33912 / PCC 7942 / FACHB-805) TaxID=1140 RepID=Q31KB3_SYNE7|nr:conserved hypothetical protein [Synechococcus elongatus PCC 7942 = FACHB-805]AJD57035.1 hypothetical protein M744_03840 [Synechococcus elongatus UTEX 2973]
MSWLCSLSMFSREHCIALCGALVPLTILLTFSAILLVLAEAPRIWQRSLALAGALPAILMVLHVYSWWAVGVVAAPTFILCGLTVICGLIQLVILKRSLTPAAIAPMAVVS